MIVGDCEAFPQRRSVSCCPIASSIEDSDSLGAVSGGEVSTMPIPLKLLKEVYWFEEWMARLQISFKLSRGISLLLPYALNEIRSNFSWYCRHYTLRVQQLLTDVWRSISCCSACICRGHGSFHLAHAGWYEVPLFTALKSYEQSAVLWKS